MILCVAGGKRPKICGPGMVCAAAEGNADVSGGAVEVPLPELIEVERSLAEAEGTGR